ncbi:MAG: hypothetical protein KDC83_10345 [Flavobacteriales bacterium]|nr:hypothetical protein [Flavobacteriales bacterium]
MKNKFNYILLGYFLFAGLSLSAQNQIQVEELPQSIQSDLTSSYKKYKVNEVWEIEKDGNVAGYKVLVQRKNNVLNLKYNLDGILYSKSKSKSFTFDTNERVKPRDEGNVEPPPMPNL